MHNTSINKVIKSLFFVFKYASQGQVSLQHHYTHIVLVIINS